MTSLVHNRIKRERPSVNTQSEKLAGIRRALRSDAAKLREAYQSTSQRQSKSKVGRLIARVAC